MALPYSIKNPLLAQQYVEGKLGVVVPSYAVGHLLLAYYQLSGKKIDPKTMEIYHDYLQQRYPLLQCQERSLETKLAEDAYSAWTRTLRKFQEKSKIDEKLLSRFMTGFYVPEKALLFATQKLNELMKKEDSDSLVLAWLEQQERVWKTESSLPDLKKGNSDEIYESAYQYASALFYRKNFIAAAKEYAELSKQKNQQDKGLAAYMELRSYYHLALEQSSSTKLAPDFAQLKKALPETQSFLSLMNSPYLEDVKILNELVFAHEEPEKYINFVAEKLRQQESGSLLRRWNDLNFLAASKTLNNIEQADDLAAWIFLLKDNAKFTTPHSAASFAWQKWQQTKGQHWLVATLMKADAGFVYTDDLFKTLAVVDPKSPAYETLQFYRIHFLHTLNRNQEAWQLLSKESQQKAASVIFQNRLSDLAFDVAPSLETLSPFLVQQAVAIGVNGEEEIQALGKEQCQSYELGSKKTLETKAIFNHKIVEKLGFYTPKVLYDFFANKTQFKSLAKPIAIAVFTRALYLGDKDLALQSGQWLQDLDPRFAMAIKELQILKSEDFAYGSNLFLLRHPALTIHIELVRRDNQLAITAIDESGMGDNWWVVPSSYKSMAEENLKSLFKEDLWLSKEEKEEAIKVWNALTSRDLSLIACQVILQRLQENPNDETIPEAIHHVIKLTKRTGVAPKESFELFKILHAKYKETKWAHETKYHYYNPEVGI